MTARDTGTEDLLASLNGGVLTLTLNRPQARNAMSGAMNQALGEQLAWAELSPEVKVVVLTGAGQGFCAGGDVKSMAQRNEGGREVTIDEAIASQRINQRATAGRLFKMAKPTVAALPGAAAGAGLALALACDLRIMASTAILTTAFAKVGFAGDYGGTYFLTQLVGAAKAREMYFLSRPDQRRRGPAPGPGQLGGRAGWSWRPRPPRSSRPPGQGPDHRLPLHEGKPQPRHGRRGRRVPGPGSHPPRPLRPDRRPQGSGQGLRREARAGVRGSVGERLRRRNYGDSILNSSVPVIRTRNFGGGRVSVRGPMSSP